jgi:hypothetical protein
MEQSVFPPIPTKSSVPPPNTGNVFFNHKTWWLALLMVCVAIAIIFPPEHSSREVSWVYALGRNVVMFITALVLAGIS